MEDLKEGGTFHACKNTQAPLYQVTLLDSSDKITSTSLLPSPEKG